MEDRDGGKIGDKARQEDKKEHSKTKINTSADTDALCMFHHWFCLSSV